MSQFFVNDGINTKGPFSVEELKAQNIKGNHLVWKEGMPQWIKAESHFELQNLFEKEIIPPPLLNSIVPSLPYEDIPFYKKSQNIAILAVSTILITLLSIFGINYFKQAARAQAEDIIRLKEENKKAEDDLLAQEKDAAMKKRIYYFKNHVTDYFTATTNNFNVDNFLGGITDLNITVINNSEFTVDYVSVEVDYIKASGGIYKTEYLSFYNVKAKGSLIQKAPDSPRGTSINYRIRDIVCERIGLEYNIYN